MKELLRQWAELEPEWCAFIRDQPYVFTENGHLSHEINITLSSDISILQGTIQQAIEMQGWLWNIWKNADGFYNAKIVGSSDDTILTIDNLPEIKSNNIIIALLSAYIKALETKNENNL